MRRALLACLVAVAVVAAACSTSDEPIGTDSQVVAEGLLNPIGLALLPDGGLLIAEEGTGEDDTSAGVSLMSEGRVERVVSGLPSGRDSGDLSGVPLVGVSPDGALVYTAHFGAGTLLTLPPPSLNAVDAGVVLGADDLGTAMEPLNRVEVVNPFDITFSPDGRPVVTDASGNGVAMETSDGQTRFIHRFGELTDPGDDAITVDPVPTGIARVGDEYYVTLFGGCPYPEGVGRLVAIDGERGERIVADGLTMPIDVTVDGAGTVWVLEFAQFEEGASCFSGEGYQPATGRLGRLVDGELETVADGLDFPGSVLAAPDGSLYVSEVFGGRILQIVPDGVSVAATGPPARPWSFHDVATAAGVDFEHGAFRTGLSEDPVAMMGGGVCWIDLEGDGDLDLYLVNSHATAETGYWEDQGDLPRNGLYRNDDGAFVDVGSGSGADLAMRGNGCVVADFDADGDADIYVTADGPNALLDNDGEGRFADIAAASGVTASEWSTAAVAGDIDGDGRLDLFVGSYIDLALKIDKPSGAFPQDYIGIANHLFLGQSDGTFVDAIADTPLLRDDRTLGALLSDLDGDGDLDLYVANDGQPNNLYENRSRPGIVELVDVTSSASVGDSGSGMGVAGGDFDGDGAADLMVTNWEAELHALYRHAAGNAGLDFVYSTHRVGLSGLGNGDTGWGTAWADFDLDTDLDLLIANGRVPVTDLATDPELIQLLGNLTVEGRVGELRDWTERTGLEALGPRLSRGAAIADFDDDGDLDVAINQIAGPAVLLRNDAPAGRFVTVVADPPVPGVRATVTLPDGTALVRELHAGASYLSSHDPRLHFGVGDAEVVTLEVSWPDGTGVRRDGVATNAHVVVSAG